ncbi:MAG TPA: DUF3131 domain-containing protein [Thermoanaerobaculia bacterium]|nr:DUF3131 domain-containing protein [Thermoanaerobaculia bacterium]
MNTRLTIAAIVLLIAAGLSAGATQNKAKGGPAHKAPGKHPGVTAQPAAEGLTRRSGPLTEEEKAIAEVAWSYFAGPAYHKKSGFVDAVAGYPSTTMWDTAAYIAALMSAYELGIIDRHEFDDRVVRFSASMNRLDLFRNELPNKAYNSETMEKVDYLNKPGEIGYSAIDLGRMLTWLRILRDRYPEHANGIDHILLRWKFCHVIDERGQLFGAQIVDVPQPVPAAATTPVQKPTPPPQPLKVVQYLQEGRLGYEEYAAKGFQLWGFRTELASRPDPFATVNIYGIDVPFDTRDPRTQVAHSYVVTESYVLDGIESGWDLISDCTSSEETYSDTVAADFASRIFRVQFARYCKTGVITARSEHQLDQSPYFVYDSIFSDGYPWNTITDKGAFRSEFAAVSTKAALGMWALWDSPYTDILYRTVRDLNEPGKGFYEGLYENGNGPIRTFTANTNGIILETLLFKVKGSLITKQRIDGIWESTIRDDFALNAESCRPKCPRVACTSSPICGTLGTDTMPASALEPPCSARPPPCHPQSPCTAH